MLASHLGVRLGAAITLDFDSTRSGPRTGETEPFSSDEVDLAFVCATSYVWMTTPPADAVELVGAAWAPTDPRARARPRYFGDLLAPVEGPAGLAGLAGRRVAYNDDVSLSGFHSLRLALMAAGLDPGRVDFVRSGSHLGSLDLLVNSRVDAAAIDSNVWRRRRRESPELAEALRPVATLGPHPTQPLVARRDLPGGLRRRIRDALLEAHTDRDLAVELRASELSHFVAVDDTDYAGLRQLMATHGLGGSTGAPVRTAPAPRSRSG